VCCEGRGVLCLLLVVCCLCLHGFEGSARVRTWGCPVQPNPVHTACFRNSRLVYIHRTPLPSRSASNNGRHIKPPRQDQDCGKIMRPMVALDEPRLAGDLPAGDPTLCHSAPLTLAALPHFASFLSINSSSSSSPSSVRNRASRVYDSK